MKVVKRPNPIAVLLLLATLAAYAMLVSCAQTKPKTVDVEPGAVQVKGVDAGQLKEISAKISAQADEIAWLKGQLSIKTGNITTGGTTHIVLLVLGLAVIGMGGYLVALHWGHSSNRRDIATLKAAINPLRAGAFKKEPHDG